MKIFVKTLNGSHFEIEVQPENTVADVKKSIETIQGQSVYPAAQQMLIHQGKVLKDDTTLEENKIAENSFVVIMLTKTKSSTSGGPSASAAAPPSKVPTSTPLAIPSPAAAPQALVPEPAAAAAAPAPAPAPVPAPAPAAAPSLPASEIDIYDQAASNLVAGSNFNQSVEQILDMGGGSWDRDTVVRALRAAFNNPERAVEYLYSGIPEQADVPPVVQSPPSGQPPNPAASQQPAQPVPVASSGPNANPLNLFPQGFPNVGTNAGEAGPLDFLRDSPQFQTLRTMVQANPQVLQPMLQELAKQNPQLVRLIQEHNADFLRLINEPGEGQDSIFGLPEAMPQAIQVTLEERDAIERLESMGFDRATVLEVYFACNKNEELAANYLLDHMHEFED